jgi:hypothetical protein
MRKILLFAAAMAVGTAPVLAEADRLNRTCSPPTTGSLPSDMNDLEGANSLSTRVKVTPPEDSWQERAREDAELRRREEAEGCPAE